MNAHASSSGRIELKKDSSSGFYVDADFASVDTSKTSSNSAVFDDVKMTISIVNEETLVASSCLNFSPYDCSRYSCSEYNIPFNIDFPSFTVTGATEVRSYIYLDYQYWNIDDSYFYTADSCQTGEYKTDIGKDRSGVVGLGTGPLSKSSYTHAPLFSFLINSNLTGGELLFMKESKYIQAGPLYTFKSNSTWQIPPDSDASIKISGIASSVVPLPNLSVMFDVNSDAIGLPEPLYTDLLVNLLGLPYFKCNGAGTYRPYCYTTGKFEDLPDIILSINSTQIIIPYKIYASEPTKSGANTFFYFNFKATGAYESTKGYVTPSFKNSIILDAHFMSYYYTVFDGTGTHNVIQIYSTAIPDSEPFAKWIIFVALGVILLVGLGGLLYWLKMRRDSVNKINALIVPTTTEGFETAKAPLVDNLEEAKHSAPSDAENAINLNGSAQHQVQIYPQLEGPGYVPPVATEDFKERAKP